jgi:hypothetical protein
MVKTKGSTCWQIWPNLRVFTKKDGHKLRPSLNYTVSYLNYLPVGTVGFTFIFFTV